MILRQRNLLNPWLRPLLVMLFFTGLLANIYPARSAPMHSFTVNITFDGVDNNPGDMHCDASPNPGDQCTLRAAIMETNALAGVHEIHLEPGIYTLDGNANEDDCESGDLDIKGHVTISATDASSTIVDGGGNDRIFHVFSGVTATFDNFTVRNGLVSGENNEGAGGGILIEQGIVALNDMRVIDNTASYGGGIVNLQGEVTITGNLLAGNRASELNGGGILNAGALTLTNSTLSDNRTTLYGGGMATLGTAGTLVENSTLKDNQALGGGGLFFRDGLADLINSTISGNQAQYGGGIYVNDASNSEIELRNVTVAFNTANVDGAGFGGGGGIYVEGDSPHIYFQNTVLANNTRQTGIVYLNDDCDVIIYSKDYNLIHTTIGCQLSHKGASPNTKRPSVADGRFHYCQV